MNTGQFPDDGLLLLDKPVSVSSFQALYPVKRVFRGRKIGHAGTLDPAASGLLVVGVGAGTRLLEFLEGLPKRYRFAARLGVVTDTFDLEGKILEQRDAGDITREQVEAVLLKFRGEITQLPPVYSAIKIQGKRACDRVRAGETVTLNPRQIRIDRLQVTAFEKGVVTLEMDCSKGTYVRTIAHDIGRELGCGAAADAIRRLSVGLFQVGDAIAPDAVTGSENLIPVEKGVDHLSAIKLRSDSWVEALLHGNPVPAASYTATPPTSPLPFPGVSTGSALRHASAKLSAGAQDGAGSPQASSATGENCGIFSPTGKLLAIGTVTASGQVQPRKVLQATK